MAVSANTIAPKNVRDLLENLAPLGQIDGVRDYLLADCQGRVLARKPGSFWKEDVAAACARDVAQVGEIFSLLTSADATEKVLDFRFEGSLLLVWDWGGAYLVALCGHDVNHSIARMTVNVIKEELRKDRRFKGYFAPPSGGDESLLTEQHLGKELYRYVAALKQT